MKFFFILIIQIILTNNIFCQKVDLIRPDNNAVINNTQINFSWNKIQKANNYQFQLSLDSNFISTFFDSLLDNTNISINNIPHYEKIFWRVRAVNETYLEWSHLKTLTLIDIASINNISCWYTADSTHISSNFIDTLFDLSINNNNAFQLDILKSPILNENIEKLNKKSTISFDGDNDFLTITDSIKPVSIFTLSKFKIGNNLQMLIGSNAYNNIRAYPSDDYIGLYMGNALIGNFGNNVTNFFILSVRSSINNTTKVKYNNNESIFNTNETFIKDIYNLAAWNSNNYRFKGDLAEILVIDTIINDSLSNLIHQYLRYKYAPPVNLGYNINIPYGYCDTTIDAGARFTDYLWSTGDTTQTITTNKSGQYSVTVTDIFGFESSDSLIVYYPEPFQLKDTLICYGDTLLWKTNLLDTNYTYLWQDNSTDSMLSVFTQGDYYVQITDTNGIGCIYNTDTLNIQLNNYPITVGLGNDTTLCAGQALYLQTGFNETVNYNWSTTETSDFIVINNPDNYSVTVTDTLGCIAIDTINIQIGGQAPITGFYFANTCLNDQTIFTDTSLTTDGSNIISWDWDFTNGNTSISQNPQIQFVDTGNYQVSLTVTTDSSCSNTIITNIKVFPLPLPDFSLPNLCSNNDAYFEDNSTIINDTIVSWYWDLGNSVTSTDTNATTIYTTSDNYTVTLKTTSINNCVDSIKKTFFVKQSPHPDFTVANTCEGKSTAFYNLTEDEGVWSIMSQAWDFGAGGTSTSVNPSIVFPNAGTYTVSLSAKLINGCSDTITKDITIYENPTANFYVDNICVDKLSSFIDSSTSNNNIVNWLWKIDTIASQDQNVELTFDTTANITVNLMVTTDMGCYNSYTRNLTINPLPIVDFTPSVEIGVVPLNVWFTPTDSSINSIWDLGDGNFAYDSVINHTYQDSGLYKITLVQETDFGCKDSTYKYVKAVVPFIDLAIFSSDFEIENKSLALSTNLINLGTLPINKIELFINVDKSSTIKEVWVGTLYSGEILEYNFTSIYELSDYQTPEFICVLANPIFDIYTDDNNANNEECLSVNNEFNLLQPYPNPANGNVYFHFIAPSDDYALITITDSDGRKVKEYTEESTKGYNKFNFSLNNISKGNYSISVKFGEKTQTKKFIVY